MPFVDILDPVKVTQVGPSEDIVAKALASGFTEFLRGDNVWCALSTFGTPKIKYFFNVKEKTIELIIRENVRAGAWPLR